MKRLERLNYNYYIFCFKLLVEHPPVTLIFLRNMFVKKNFKKHDCVKVRMFAVWGGPIGFTGCSLRQLIKWYAVDVPFELNT